MDERSIDERLADVEQRIADIRKAAGVSLGQNALTNLKAELERLEAEQCLLEQERDGS